MSPLLNRTGHAGPFLEWKVRLFTVGATLALGGMYLDEGWLVGVAIGVLAAGIALRFLPGEREAERDPESGESEGEAPDSDDPGEAYRPDPEEEGPR